jgi:uncharacterized protein (TIGR03083 family)
LDRAANLSGWNIAELGVHVTRVSDSILVAVQRATVGDTTPAFGPAAKPREDAIRAMTPAGWAQLLDSACQQLRDLVASLSNADIEQMMFPHGQGPRNVSWFCTQLLAEVAFHRWDLERSLDFEGSLSDGLARYLLPFLLDPAHHLFGRRHTSGEQQTFSVRTGGSGWELTVTAEGTKVRLATSSADGAQVLAPAGWLALAIYGRVRIDGPAFTIDGPAETANRFAAIFGPN